MTVYPERIAYGLAEDMIAEVSAFDMGAEWRAQYGYTHIIKCIGAGEWDIEHCKSEEEAREAAESMADDWERVGAPRPSTTHI